MNDSRCNVLNVYFRLYHSVEFWIIYKSCNLNSYVTCINCFLLHYVFGLVVYEMKSNEIEYTIPFIEFKKGI